MGYISEEDARLATAQPEWNTCRIRRGGRTEKLLEPFASHRSASTAISTRLDVTLHSEAGCLPTPLPFLDVGESKLDAPPTDTLAPSASSDRSTVRRARQRDDVVLYGLSCSARAFTASANGYGVS